MAYFNDSDNFDSAPEPTAPEVFDSYPSLQCQTSTNTDSAYHQEAHTSAGSWATVDRLGPPTTAPTGLGATSYEPVLPAFDSYSAPLEGSYWSMTSRQNEPVHAGSWNQDNFFASGQGWGTMMPALNSDPVPANLWADQQRWAPSNASYTENPPNHHQSGSGVARTGMTDRQRCMPYDTYHGRTDGDWQTTQPTGGISETTADAKQNKKTTEDNETPAPQTRCARGQGPPRPHRDRSLEDVRQLRAWAKALRGSREPPSHLNAITDAAEVISVFLQPVYNEDRLHRVHGQRTGTGSKRADGEYRRRNDTRQVYQRLSRLYRLEGGRDSWTMTELASRVLEDLEIIDRTLRSGFVPA